MEKEFLYGITGLIGGAILGSTASSVSSMNNECISTPLNNSPVIPQLSLQDYLDETEFNPNYKDWWLLFVGQDNAITPNVYGILNLYDIDKPINGQSYLHKFIIYNATKKQTATRQDTAILNIDQGTGTITLTSGIGTTIYDTAKSQTGMQIPEFGIKIVHQGYPVKLNDGQITVQDPGKYLIGFDTPGQALGTVGGANVAGYVNFERAKWNMELGQTPRYAWIPFSGSKISGIFVCMKFWKDAGIWYSGQYLKPDYYEVENSGIDSMQSKKVIAYFSDLFGAKNQFLELDMTRIDVIPGMNMETIYKVSILLNGTVIDQGFAWQESSPF